MPSLKSTFKKVLDKVVNPHVDRLAKASGISAVDKGVQIQLILQYRNLVHQKLPLPSFAEVGFRAFSQFDDDGILLYLFALLGTTNRKVVEICAGNGIECNAANLIINHGWQALLFEGDKANIQRGSTFYRRYPETLLTPPTFVHAWIERETINDLIAKQGFQGEIDLLSLDLDGMDYWIWQTIEGIRPRVVVAEYNGGIEAERAVTVPYQKDYSVANTGAWFEGASLLALTKLAKRKGYRLVGCNRCELNAYFVRSDIGAELLPEVTVSSCLVLPRSNDPARRAALAQFTWEEV